MWNSIEKDHYYYCFDDDLFTKELSIKMKKYIVTMKEVHSQEIIVEAASPEHASPRRGTVTVIMLTEVLTNTYSIKTLGKWGRLKWQLKNQLN